MMRRYSILVIEYGSKHEVELCQVDQHPHEIAAGATAKRLTITTDKGKRASIPKYTSVRVRENRAPAEQ